jgi:hypothetical protein
VVRTLRMQSRHERRLARGRVEARSGRPVGREHVLDDPIVLTRMLATRATRCRSSHLCSAACRRTPGACPRALGERDRRRSGAGEFGWAPLLWGHRAGVPAAVMVDLGRMDRILRVDRRNRMVGWSRGHLCAVAARVGQGRDAGTPPLFPGRTSRWWQVCSSVSPH